jgi:uncharacterized protein YpmS
MINFEPVTAMKQKAVSKWHLMIALLAINLVGFAVAQVYFSRQGENKTQSEASEVKKTYGMNVRETSTLLNWGFNLLQHLRNHN